MEIGDILADCNFDVTKIWITNLLSRGNKSVRFTKIEEARPRVTSLPGRLISGFLSATTGRVQSKVKLLNNCLIHCV